MLFYLRQKSYLLGLSLTIILFTGLTILVHSLVFSRIYEGSLSDNLKQEYRERLRASEAGLGNLVRSMDQLYVQMKLDPNIYSGLYAAGPEEVLRIRAVIAADKYSQISPYIAGITIWNSHLPDDTIPEYIRSGIEEEAGNSSAVLRKVRQMTDPLRPERKLLALLYGEASSYSGHLENCVVILLDMKAVSQGILSQSGSPVRLLDLTGRILYTDSDRTTEDLPAGTVWQEAVNNGMQEDVSGQTRNRKHQLVAYIRNDEAGWILAGVKEYEDMLSDIRGKLSRVMVTGLLLLVVSVPVALVLAFRLYAPVRRVIAEVRGSEFGNPPGATGEMAVISGAYRSVTQQAKDLQREKQLYLPQLRLEYLRAALLGELPEGSAEPAGGSDGAVFIVTVRFSCELAKTWREAWANALYLHTAQDFTLECLSIHGGDEVVLVRFRQPGDKTFDFLVSRLSAAVRAFGEATQGVVQANIGMGGYAELPADYHGCYVKSQEMLHTGFVAGYGHIISHRFIEENLNSGVNYPKELEKRLLTAVMMNQKKVFCETLDEITGIVSGYFYGDAVMIFLNLVLECIRAMNQAACGFRKFQVAPDQLSLLTGRRQTLSQGMTWLKSLFEEYQAFTASQGSGRDQKHDDMVSAIQSYIRLHYTDPGMGVESLADRAGYTASYFSRIFRSVTGQYVNDFIKQLRIAHAKTLLLEGSRSIAEVSAMVGYPNTTYFHAAFKKEVGMTPASYRNMRAESENHGHPDHQPVV